MRVLSQPQAAASASQLKMKTNRLVIVRHGESEFNLSNLFCGWHDAPLSETGIKETCCSTACNLKNSNLSFDIIYTSALSRTQHTADILVKELDCAYVPIKADWRLNERHYGDLTGYNKRQTAERFGIEQVQIWRRGYHGLPPPISLDNPYYYQIRNNPSFADVPANQFPYTESMAMCVNRVLAVWNEIKAEVLKGTRVLLCVHGTVARALIKHIEGLTETEITKVNVPNGIPCVYEFDLKSGKPLGKAKYLGDPEYIKKKTAEVADIGK